MLNSVNCLILHKLTEKSIILIFDNILNLSSFSLFLFNFLKNESLLYIFLN